MASLDSSILSPSTDINWSEKIAKEIATREGITLNNEHLDVIRSIQEYYSKHQSYHINMRELHDALAEKFHQIGGMKYLYTLFPGGPVAQGCRIAGLEPPAGAIDKGFGSVV